MDWICPLGSTAISGLHIGLWIVAYAVWRVLVTDWRGVGVMRGAGTPGREKALNRRRMSRLPAGQRWAKRAEMLERMHNSAHIVSAKRRDKTRRAA